MYCVVLLCCCVNRIDVIVVLCVALCIVLCCCVNRIDVIVVLCIVLWCVVVLSG